MKYKTFYIKPKQGYQVHSVLDEFYDKGWQFDCQIADFTGGIWITIKKIN